MNKILLVEDVSHIPVSWPAAYRLRPIELPSAPTLSLLGEDEQDIMSLIDMSSPRNRHETGAAPHTFSNYPRMPMAVRSAFAHPSPEWRFTPASMPHISVAEHISAAVSTASEQYGQFLADTNQVACKVSLALERYVLSGDFYDVRDRKIYTEFYDKSDSSIAQNFVATLSSNRADGLIYSRDGGDCAVVLNPDCVEAYAKERALAMQWDGKGFTRYFDYRDLHWVNIPQQ